MRRIQHRLRGQAGFTMIEAVIVVALMGLLAALTIPSFGRYRTRSHARSHAERVMGVLQTARAQAVQFGQPVLVLFDDARAPTAGDWPVGVAWPDGVFARIVRDTNGNDFAVDDTDQVTDVELEAGLADVVSTYGQGGETPAAGAAVPDEDDAGGTLGALDQGTSFPKEALTGLRGVAFTPQGMAVAIDSPGTPVTGAFYVTDNNTAVFAVVLHPLGTVSMRSLNPETQQWN
jgi:prepilin-type N-terminal cleavage/methylation domain-containing protein